MGRWLPHALAREFSARTRMKGDEYVAMGLIRIASGSEAEVSAIALGTNEYRVSIIRRDRGTDATFAISCECPFYLQDFNPCKHIWGTLAIAEREGYLGSDG